MRAILLVALLVAPVVLAEKPAFAPWHSHVTAAPAVPVVLSRGAAGTATLGANATSGSDAATGGVGTTSAANSTALRNAGAVDLQVRLVYVGVSGTVAQCAQCDLQLRNATATTTEIAIAAVAPASGAAGPWVTLRAGQSCWLWALARANLLADTAVTVSYRVEMQPLSGSVAASYPHMSLTFTV